MDTESIKVAEEWELSSGQRIVHVHLETNCQGPCALHRPSNHHMRSWPLSFRGDRYMFERICPHGVGHPDPDWLAGPGELIEGAGIHGCDGCCSA